MGILDFIFPKRCINCQKIGEYVCSGCFVFLSFDTKSQCLVCRRQSLNNLTHKACLKKDKIDGYFSGIAPNRLSYKLLSRFKSKPYLSDLADFLSELFYESLIQNENFMNLIEKDKFAMSSVSLNSSKLKKRGYNQATLLAKKLSKKLNIPFVELSQKAKIRGNNILIVDDIVKTGSTLKAIAFVLKQSGARKVFGLTLIGIK